MLIRFFRDLWRSITAPPYANLPWLVWLYIVLCAAILHHGGIFAGHLLDFDDQVRMTQVLNWVNGAGWYDRTITRVNAPEGFTTIWARLVDMPIAAVVVVAQQLVPQRLAALVATGVVPLIEIAVLFVAAPYFVRPLVGKNRANLIVLFLLFTSLLNVKPFSASGFLFGQASHHPWYIILDLLLFGAVARLCLGSFSRAPMVMLGVSIALLTAVGIEGYPMIAAAAAVPAVLAWATERPLLARTASRGFLWGSVSSLLLLPMHQPPEKWLTVSFAEPSVLGGILVGSAAGFLLVTAFVLGKYKGKRLVTTTLLVGTALLIGGGLIYAFPDILNGAGAALSPSERKMAAIYHSEAKSLYAVAQNSLDLINLAMPLLLGLAAAVYGLRYAKGRRRAVYFAYFSFAALSGLLCCLFSRFYHHAMATACAWLLWAWLAIKARLRMDGHYSLKALAVFIFLAPFWMLLLPVIETNSPMTTHLLLFPAVLNAGSDPCDSLSIAGYINKHYDKDTRLIVPYWKTAQFLYQTDIKIDFLANFPSQDKYKDNYKFFETTTANDAKDIALRHDIDLVSVCEVPSLYRAGYRDDQQLFLALMQVGHVPAWLKPVVMGIPTNYHLYKVDKDLLKAKDGHG